MISSAFLAPLGVLLACASRAVALESISIQSTVKADTEVEVKISNDLADGKKSFDAEFTNYNLYLSTTPPGWGTGPVCLLANNTKIDVTSVKVKIPADAVPDGAKLKITSQSYSDQTSTGLGYSNSFTFEGGTAEWGKSELAGVEFAGMLYLPCSAYGCARKCNDKYYDERNKNTADINSNKNTYECVAACPGATLPTWQSVIDEYNNSNGTEDSGSGSSASASASGTASSGVSAATALTSPTGSSSAGPTSASTTSASTTSASTTSASTTSASTSSPPLQTPNGAIQVMSGGTWGAVLAGLVAVYGLF